MMLRRLVVAVWMAVVVAPAIAVAAESRPALTAQQLASIDAFVTTSTALSQARTFAIGSSRDWRR